MNDMGKQITYQELLAAYNKLLMENEFLHKEVDRLQAGKSGYQPVCRNEWDRQLCDKKKYKCAECPNRLFKPLVYEDIYRHLEGKDPDGQDVIGAYAILADNKTVHMYGYSLNSHCLLPKREDLEIQY